MQFYPGYFETERKKCRALFIKKYPSSLSDTFLNEITSLPVHSITTICIVPVPKELAGVSISGSGESVSKKEEIPSQMLDFLSGLEDAF